MPNRGESRQKGFTLIEMLIVIAITLILLTGAATTSRLLVRSTRLARETDRASAILSDQLAELRSRGLQVDRQTIHFNAPAESGPLTLGEASGEIRFDDQDATGLVVVEASLRWRSLVGHRELNLATLMRPAMEGKR